jgi:hypothetical protein
MYRLIAEQAGHRAIAEMMTFVDLADYEQDGLERLDSERRAALRRTPNPAPAGDAPPNPRP